MQGGRRVVASGLLVAALLAGCESKPQISSRRRPLELAAGSPARSSVPVAVAQGRLVPGTYYTSRFRPTLVFTVPEGWTLDSESAGLLYLVRGSFPDDYVDLFVLAAQRGKPTVVDPPVFTDGVGSSLNKQTKALPTDYVEYIASSPYLDAGSVGPGEVLGLRGSVVDAVVARTPGGTCGGLDGLCFALFRDSGGAVNLYEVAGAAMRVWSVNGPGGRLIVVAAASDASRVASDALATLLGSMELS